MIGAAELWGRSQPALSPTTLSTMPPTRPATERIRNPNDALRHYHRSITVILLCLAMFSTVCAAPLRETPSDELLPLSVQDGFYPLSVANNTNLKELSRHTFYSLYSAEVPEQIGPPPVFLQENRQFHKKNKTAIERKNKPGRKKPVYNGRKELLKILLDKEKRPQQICKGETFKQRVKVPGCLTKTIVNRFCHGVCSSYFIPRMSRKLKAFFKSCAYCGPKEYDYVDVTLDCPGQDPPQITKRITKVKKCACINHDYKQHL